MTQLEQWKIYYMNGEKLRLGVSSENEWKKRDDKSITAFIQYFFMSCKNTEVRNKNGDFLSNCGGRARSIDDFVFHFKYYFPGECLFKALLELGNLKAQGIFCEDINKQVVHLFYGEKILGNCALDYISSDNYNLSFYKLHEELRNHKK